VPRYVDLWPPDLRLVILSVRPGITAPATVLLRSEGGILAHSPDPERTYVEELLPLKAQAYVSYVRSRSLVGDIKIMLATFKAIIHRAPSARLPKDLETR
jgi:lipopolysaccharide/colanic/teichoic acid biosynthesis glycosyltransferase